MIGCLRTRVRKQPIIALYFESEHVLKFYNLEAWSRDYKPLLCSTGLIIKFILLIHVKIPTAVCIIQNNYQHLSVFKQGMSLFYCFFKFSYDR